MKLMSSKIPIKIEDFGLVFKLLLVLRPHVTI